jgi:hypothetical protein
LLWFLNYYSLLQLLRQLLDNKVLCTLQKPFEWRTIEGLVILSAMSMNETPSVTNRMLNQRLLVSGGFDKMAALFFVHRNCSALQFLVGTNCHWSHLQFQLGLNNFYKVF